MADQQVSPLETASIHLELISFLPPQYLVTGHLGRPRFVEPPYNPPSPGRRAWGRVDTCMRVPIGACLASRTDMPTIEILKPLAGPEEAGQQAVDSFNQLAFPTYLVESDAHIRAAYSRQSAPIAHPLAATQLAPIADPPLTRRSLTVQDLLVQPSQVSSAIENRLAVLRPTFGESSATIAPLVAYPAANEKAISKIQHGAAPTGLGSAPPLSSSSTLALPVASNQVATLQSQESHHGLNTVSPAVRTGSSLGNNSKSSPTPMTSPEDSPGKRDELSRPDDATIPSDTAFPVQNGRQNTTSITALSLQGGQPDMLIGRAELPWDNKPSASSIAQCAVESHKRKLEAHDRESNNSELDLDSKFNPPPAGFLRSPITGQIRPRCKMDDSPDYMRKKYREQRTELCQKDRGERGPIDRYEEGDSDLEFSDWEEAKEERRRTKKRKL